MNSKHSRLFTLAALLALPLAAQALTIVTDRAALVADDRVDWRTQGTIFTLAQPAYLSSTFAIDSADGLSVEVRLPPPAGGITQPLVFQTGPHQEGKIPTNFTAGDYVLFSGLDFSTHPARGNPGPLTIEFATPVRAAGAQLALDDTTVTYTLSVSAYDATGALLARFDLADSTSSTDLDNSAAFLGVRGDTANIKTLVYSSSIDNRALGINQLDIVSAAPEPGGLVAAGLLVLVGRRLAARGARPAGT